MTVKDYIQEHQERLDLYTKAIVNAHGQHHPEVYEVRELYKEIEMRSLHHQDIQQTVARLKAVTSDFAVPSDVCQTFLQTYEMLGELAEIAASERQSAC
ncbi:hypothetical protein EDD63_10285 [Breznakia blatticola]|uniref:Regulator of cell morphogenesis and NO signaling n=1 Tax=Breznakia blatticola TaxID=1754012 RepID=A0A4V3G9A4_9FIRM|nr:iron-sulfur cluster repair di-iron protein, ric [Breznakia blatticola]TDW26064.1 hypothetical protein EDD63_10285 [Breznakia blatticola]